MIRKINNIIAGMKSAIARHTLMCHCEERSDEAISKIRGQAALILILLSAAALILLAITLNWGRIAQVKSVLTISSDVSASTLASDAASYGEMEKQTYLGNSNYSWRIGGVVLGIILLIAAIVLLYFWSTSRGFYASVSDSHFCDAYH